MQKPVVLQFPVNDVCNSKCQMCNIWENKKSTDITPERVRDGFQSSLFSEVTSVGINGGEPTLREDLPALVDAMFDGLGKLKEITLITNGYKTAQVVERVLQVAEVCHFRGASLNVMVSLDGYGQVHDDVRRRSDYFSRSTATIEQLRHHPNISGLSVACTVIKENVFALADLLDYCIVQDLAVKFRLGIPHKRLYTLDKEDTYLFSSQEKYELAEFIHGLLRHYEKAPKQRYFYQSLIEQLVNNAPRKAGCLWQHKGATVTHKGELAYCAVKSPVVVNDISAEDPLNAYFDGEPILQQIRAQDCADCHHDYLDEVPEKPATSWITKSLLKFDWYRKAKQRAEYKQHYQQLLTTVSRPLDHKAILICGWYGTETLGDKAILGGILDELLHQQATDARIYLCSLFPYVSEQTQAQMPELQNITLVDVEQALSIVDQVDTLIFGGGPVMTTPPIVEMAALFTRARQAGKNTVVAGCGVGPLGEPSLTPYVKQVLDNAKVKIYRDNNSAQIAQQLGVSANNATVSHDPAFLWLDKYRPIPTVKTNEKRVLLLGLREPPNSEYGAHLDAKQSAQLRHRFDTTILDALIHLCEQDSQWEILPIPMCTNHIGNDDRWYYRELFRGNRLLKDRVNMQFLYQELKPSDYLLAFSCADVCLTMRFHSLVFSLACNKPSVAIDYTFGKGKVAALAGNAGIAQRDISQLSSDWLVTEIQNAKVPDYPKQDTFKQQFRAAMNNT